MAYAKTTKIINGGLQGDISLCSDTNGSQFILKRFYDKRHLHVEREVLTQCQGSSYIAQMHTVTLPAHHNNSLALQYYCHGDMFNLLQKAHERNLMTEQLAKSMFKKIVLAVAELHQKEIVHRDIKPENIFVDADFNLLLGDFGLASIQNESKVDNNQLINLCGTKSYMAPEVIACEVSGRRYNGYASDMWSLACMLFLLLTGNMPLGEQGACRRDWYFNRIQAGEWSSFWQQHDSVLMTPLSAEAKDMVSVLFKAEPESRLSAETVLELSWFKDENMLSDEQYFDCMSHIAQLE